MGDSTVWITTPSRCVARGEPTAPAKSSETKHQGFRRGWDSNPPRPVRFCKLQILDCRHCHECQRCRALHPIAPAGLVVRSRPLLRPVQDANDVDRVPAHRVDHDVRQGRHDKLACAPPSCQASRDSGTVLDPRLPLGSACPRGREEDSLPFGCQQNRQGATPAALHGRPRESASDRRTIVRGTRVALRERRSAHRIASSTASRSFSTSSARIAGQDSYSRAATDPTGRDARALAAAPRRAARRPTACTNRLATGLSTPSRPRRRPRPE